MIKTIQILFLATVAIIAQPAKQQRFDDLSDRPVDIARVKMEHYKKSGFQILPTFFTDSTIGPGMFVGIDDATVRSGTSLRIRSGTTFMFEPGKRLIVEGKLIALAEPSKAVLLTNVPLDLRYFKVINPDSLWGGIQVESGATLDLERVKVSCAVSGITGSGEPDKLAIECVGLANRVVKPFSFDRITTPSGIDLNCFTFHFPAALPQKTLSALSENTSVEKKPIKRLGLKLGFSGLTVVGAGIAGWGLYQYGHNLDLYNKSKDPEQHTKAQVEKYESDGRAGKVIAIVGGAVAALGAAGLVMTFTF